MPPHFNTLVVSLLFCVFFWFVLFSQTQLGFTQCKAEHPLHGMELKEKEDKDKKRIRKNPRIKGAY